MWLRGVPRVATRTPVALLALIFLFSCDGSASDAHRDSIPSASDISINRFLQTQGISHHVVDSSSITVNRRKR